LSEFSNTDELIYNDKTKDSQNFSSERKKNDDRWILLVIDGASGGDGFLGRLLLDDKDGDLGRELRGGEHVPQHPQLRELVMNDV